MEKIVNDILEGKNLSDIFDEGITHINEEEDVKTLLLKKMDEDIQQYLPDVADIWGDEVVSVKVKNDDAYVVWKNHWMPVIDFYQCVSRNSGVVEPRDFENYENLL